MRPYGVDRKDFGCCPGHDKIGRGHYNSAVSRRLHARLTRVAHKRARARARVALRGALVA